MTRTLLPVFMDLSLVVMLNFKMIQNKKDLYMIIPKRVLLRGVIKAKKLVKVQKVQKLQKLQKVGEMNR